MAEVSLKIKSDFEQAQKDLYDLRMNSDKAREAAKKFSESFTGEQIDKFLAKTKLTGAAIAVTKGEMASITKQTNMLKAEMERLIKLGLDPQSVHIQKLRNEYFALANGMQKTQQETSMMGKVFNTVLGPLKSLLPAIGIGTLFKIGNDAIDSWYQAEAAVANVEAGLRSTNNALGMTSEELQAMAGAFENIGIFEEEDILQNVTAQFLTFGNISKENFERASAAALDVTAKLKGINATGEDLRGTAIMLGKALEDPEKGLTALRKVGVSFSESEQNTIRSMIEHNDVMGAQNAILSSLEKQYGGRSEALHKTTAGM